MIKIILTNDEVLSSEDIEYFVEQKEVPVHKLKKWIGCNAIEIVRVYYEKQYEQLIIDDSGLLKGLPVNIIATDIYHENVKVHDPKLLTDAPSIYGVAVLLTGVHKLT